MTQSEEKILLQNLNSFIVETRKNFSQVFEDRSADRDLLEHMANDIGSLKTQTLAVNQNIKQNTQVVKKAESELKEEIAGSTKVVIKEVDKTKQRWYQFWKKLPKKEVK